VIDLSVGAERVIVTVRRRAGARGAGRPAGVLRIGWAIVGQIVARVAVGHLDERRLAGPAGWRSPVTRSATAVRSCAPTLEITTVA